MLRKGKQFIAFFCAVSMIFLSGVIPTAISFKAASEEHIHTEECYSVSYEFGELICEKEEHLHSDDCFEEETIQEVVEDDSEQGWHYETKTNKALEASCGKEYHIHDESCYEQIEVKTEICQNKVSYNFNVSFLYGDEETGNYLPVADGSYDFTTKIFEDGTFEVGTFEGPAVEGFFWYDMHILRDKVSDSGYLKFTGFNQKTYDLGEGATWTANHQVRVYKYEPTDGKVTGDVNLELLYAPLPKTEDGEIVPEVPTEPEEPEEEEEEVIEEEEEEPVIPNPTYTLTIRYWFGNEQLSEPTVVKLQDNGFIEGFTIEDGHMENALTTKVFKDYTLFNVIVNKYTDTMPSKQDIDLNGTGLSDEFVYITGVSGEDAFEVSDNYVIDVYYTKNQEQEEEENTEEPPVVTPPTEPTDNTPTPPADGTPTPDNTPAPAPENPNPTPVVTPTVTPIITPTPIEQLEELDVIEDVIINAEEVVIPATSVPVTEVTEQVITVVDGENGLTVDLTEVSDIETALANSALGNHLCNILVFLMLSMTVVALGLYYRNARKHQERIFELRKLLGEDDPYIREFA